MPVVIKNKVDNITKKNGAQPSTKNTGIGSKQKGIGSKQKGIGSKQKGIGSKQKGIGSKQTGIASKQKGSGSKQKGSGNEESFRYRIVPVDVDNDGTHDGDMVIKLDNLGNIIEQKYVPRERMEQIVKKAMVAQEARTSIVAPRSEVNSPVHMDQRVVVQDDTSFANNLKGAFAWGLGLAAGDAVIQGVTELF
jgi:hypothetical protein